MWFCCVEFLDQSHLFLYPHTIISGMGGGGAAAGAGGGGGGGGGDGFADFGGVDPNMDPELAMALRVSMEEERARQERVSLDLLIWWFC